MAQNPAQEANVIESMIGKTSTQVEAEKEDASTSYLPFPLCTYVQNGEEGNRTLAVFQAIHADFVEGVVKSDVLPQLSDPDLAQVIRCWPALQEDARAAIVALATRLQVRKAG